MLSQAVVGAGEWPNGAAAVKELYASVDATAPVGYAVYLKQAATSNAGANWYWYERVPGDGVVADGTGGAGPAKMICVGCHAGAGSDAAHTPSAHGRDLVYTPVAPQQPPSGQAAIEPWLAQGYYKTWSCEPAIHAARSPSPHGFNRICSNNVIQHAAAATGPWPAGAAAVKEIYAAIDGTTPVGYAVYRKQDADSAAGANWYWYEHVPDGVVADGTGGAGPAKTICVGCHMAAGSDADHTPSPNGRDQVYSPIP